MNFDFLSDTPRLLMDVELRPLQGTRFQPTGFPDLGAAEYMLHDGTRVLLVESAQSMANRLEAVCWDKAEDDWQGCLKGLPYVSVLDKGGNQLTNSVLESHRLNSPYILEGKDKTFVDCLKEEIGVVDKGRVDFRKFAGILFKYDINSLVHGIFLAKKDLAGGRFRLPRVLSSFVEAVNVTIASSGGVKLDEVDPKGDTKKGYGHVPFHRDEYTGEITAYFNLDLSQIRGFGLPESAQKLLILLSLFKISNVLKDGLRFRTACDLAPVGELQVRSPEAFVMPTLDKLKALIPELIAENRHLFADPTVTIVKYEG